MTDPKLPKELESYRCPRCGVAAYWLSHDDPLTGMCPLCAKDFELAEKPVGRLKLSEAEVAVAALDSIKSDPEKAHSEADKILLAFLRDMACGEVADAWDRANRRSGGFYYA